MFRADIRQGGHTLTLTLTLSLTPTVTRWHTDDRGHGEHVWPQPAVGRTCRRRPHARHALFRGGDGGARVPLRGVAGEPEPEPEPEPQPGTRTRTRTLGPTLSLFPTLTPDPSLALSVSRRRRALRGVARAPAAADVASRCDASREGEPRAAYLPNPDPHPDPNPPLTLTRQPNLSRRPLAAVTARASRAADTGVPLVVSQEPEPEPEPENNPNL